MFVKTGLSGLGARLPLIENEAAALTLEATTPPPAGFVRSLPPVIPPRKIPPRPVPAVGPPGVQPAAQTSGSSAAPLLLSALAFFLFRGNA